MAEHAYYFLQCKQEGCDVNMSTDLFPFNPQFPASDLDAWNLATSMAFAHESEGTRPHVVRIAKAISGSITVFEHDEQGAWRAASL